VSFEELKGKPSRGNLYRFGIISYSSINDEQYPGMKKPPTE